jgi:hypothetical protein
VIKIFKNVHLVTLSLSEKADERERGGDERDREILNDGRVKARKSVCRGE